MSASTPRTTTPNPQRIELTVQGRERVTLQKTVSVPECELAPFHHLQGASHKEHHEYLFKFPKPEVRDLVKERDWRLRNGHTSPSRTLTVVEDVTRVESVFAERRALISAPAALPVGSGAPMAFSAEIPRGAPSSFYVAGGNWSVGKGYLAEIVYTVSAAVIGDERKNAAEARNASGEEEPPDPHPAADAPPLAPGEAVIGAAKRHFLVTQGGDGSLTNVVPSASPNAAFAPSRMGAAASTGAEVSSMSASSSPRMTASRQFLGGGEFRATASLDRASVAPGLDVAIVKAEVNNTGSVACTCVTVSATCSLSMHAGAEKLFRTFELAPTFHRGFAAGHFGERFHAFPAPPGWPATTAGALVRCGYGVRVLFQLPAPNRNLTLDLPITVTPTASMYSAARPAGAPFAGPESALPRAAAPLPPARLFRAPWADDAAFPACFGCRAPFTLFNRRHHCRHCGFVFCKKCAGEKAFLSKLGFGPNPQRVCRGCAAEARRTGGAFEPAEESAAYAAAAAAVGARNAAVYGNGAYANGNGGGGGVFGSPPTSAPEPRRQGELRDVSGAASGLGSPGYPTGYGAEPPVPVQDLRSFMQGGGAGGSGSHTAHTAGEGANQA